MLKFNREVIKLSSAEIPSDDQIDKLRLRVDSENPLISGHINKFLSQGAKHNQFWIAQGMLLGYRLFEHQMAADSIIGSDQWETLPVVSSESIMRVFDSFDANALINQIKDKDPDFHWLVIKCGHDNAGIQSVLVTAGIVIVYSMFESEAQAQTNTV